MRIMTGIFRLETQIVLESRKVDLIKCQSNLWAMDEKNCIKSSVGHKTAYRAQYHN